VKTADPIISLGVYVMHHPSREVTIRPLVRQLGRSDVVVIEDPHPEYIGSAWRTAREAWSDEGDPGETHRLVIQDDAWPCNGFLDAAVRVIAHYPWAAVAFWVGEDHVDAPLLRRWGGPVCPIDQQTSWAPTVALAMPSHHAREIRPHGDECHSGSRHDDQIIACYLRSAGVPLLATVPCLVDHPGALSLTGLQHQGARRAAIWIDKVDPMTLDWRVP
jgi:hypothetical protein